MCRKDLPASSKVDEEFQKKLSFEVLVCGCGVNVPILEAEDHSCGVTLASVQKAREDSSAVLQKAPAVVNRSTFSCPVCDENNLSRIGLMEHCAKCHSGRIAAVCPICAAMPWGDSSYKSNDFLSHLRLRHQCEYSELTDFGSSERDQIASAMEESMKFAGYVAGKTDNLPAPRQQSRNAGVQSSMTNVAYAVVVLGLAAASCQLWHW